MSGRKAKARRRAEDHAAQSERRHEQHAQLINRRAGDPRYAQRTVLADGTAQVSMTPDVADAMKSQIAMFREKFGREPGPDDPLLFDPDADEPVPIGVDEINAGLESLAEQAEAGEIDVDPAFIRAWIEVGYIVTEENQHLFSAADIDAFSAAVERHREL